MPEGDTIHRAVGRLRPALCGAELTDFAVQRHAGLVPQVGETIVDVRAHGKHLLIDFSGGLTLRCHLRMTGSWHLYRPNQRWQKKRTAARLVIRTPDWVAVCFSAPDIEISPGSSAGISHLGPDLCVPNADIEECLARMARFANERTQIGEALLDQRVACGVGNVYKSEVLHACRVSPIALVVELGHEIRRELLEAATRLLLANLGPGMRQTVPGGLAVYGKAGQPCPRCASSILCETHGSTMPRLTWWCPTCQSELNGPGRESDACTG